jgi:hypothetical protein
LLAAAGCVVPNLPPEELDGAAPGPDAAGDGSLADRTGPVPTDGGADAFDEVSTADGFAGTNRDAGSVDSSVHLDASAIDAASLDGSGSSLD